MLRFREISIKKKIREKLIEEGEFRKSNLASGAEGLVKPIEEGMRVEIKEISPSFIKYDIDPHDPDRNIGSWLRHAWNSIKWAFKGAQDNSVSVPTKKIMKNVKKFNWREEYEKRYQLECNTQGQCGYKKKGALKKTYIKF